MTSLKHKQLLNDKIIEINIHRQHIIKYYCNEIIGLMGGLYNMLSYPILEWDQTYMGCTGYIDRLKIKVISNKIMIGVDSWDRPFITL